MRHFAFVVFIAALAASGCKDPRRSQSSATEVPDGHVVLLKRKNEFAAFILKNQRISPEETDFVWYFRTDGRGTFAPGDPAVSTGVVTNATQISFATFSVNWSIHITGRGMTASGWVYFPNGQYDFFKAADYAMCVTTETNVAGIDARDRRWKYRVRLGVNIRALIQSQVKK